MNDSERAQWVENDEGLYGWWKGDGGGLWKWVKEHRVEIDEVVGKVLGKPSGRRWGEQG